VLGFIFSLSGIRVKNCSYFDWFFCKARDWKWRLWLFSFRSLHQLHSALPILGSASQDTRDDSNDDLKLKDLDLEAKILQEVEECKSIIERQTPKAVTDETTIDKQVCWKIIALVLKSSFYLYLFSENYYVKKDVEAWHNWIWCNKRRRRKYRWKSCCPQNSCWVSPA